MLTPGWWEKVITEDDLRISLANFLHFIGEDPKRPGLQDTPNRMIRSWKELYSGYGQDPKDILTVFPNDGSDGYKYNQIVLLKDIEFYSTCEHHVLPFFGKAHIAYIPNEKIVGISKLARVLEIYARRLQIQERIGQQVTDALMKYLKPKGAACIIEAQHQCMICRGVKKQHSTMITSSITGVFLKNEKTREELMSFIKG